jgi:hypothetical protein
LCHGPDWTNDTTRSAGTALVRVNGNGIWLNSVTIGDGVTTGPAAQRGTYVGTTRSNASSTLDWIFGALASKGTAGFFGVWNAYNRVDVASQVRDSDNSWTLAGPSAIRSANNSASMRVSFVCGLAEDAFYAQYASSGSVSVAGAFTLGIGFDATAVYSGQMGMANPGSSGGTAPTFGTFVTPALGFHFFQAMEAVITSTTATFFGNASFAGLAQNGLTFMGRM